MGTKDHVRGEDAETASESGPAEGVLLRSGNTHALSIDTALSLLKHKHRRELLQRLRRQPTRAAPLKSIAEHIARLERRHRADDGGDVDRSVSILLRHQHLPKLERAGVITFDEEADRIEYDGDPVLDAYLAVTEEIEG